VLDPILTDGLTMEDLPDLRTRVRAAIEATRNDLRVEHGFVTPVMNADESAAALAADERSSGTEPKNAS
jgi:hypothetical protein